MKTISIILLSIFIVGCDYKNPNTERSASHDEVYKNCVGGVTYLLHDRGITVMLDKDSKIIPCK